MQLTVFVTKTKINHQSDQQPNPKIDPVPNTQFSHHIQATNQT